MEGSPGVFGGMWELFYSLMKIKQPKENVRAEIECFISLVGSESIGMEIDTRMIDDRSSVW